MRLPGTRYQEHGWEQVRKLLGQCSLAAFAHASPARLLDAAGQHDALGEYIELTAAALRAAGRSARAAAPGNSYGESVLELALGLLFELQARPGDWSAFAAAVANEHQKIGPFWQQAGGEAILRKKVNDMYAVLRDKVDADNYQAACGRSCSANKIYAYRMLDTAYGDIARIFDAWQLHAGQLGAILGREVPPGAAPIEVRQLKSIGFCKAEWIIAWSASREACTGAAGPLHTRSKRFASLKCSPDKIAAMLREIGDYEELSANRDGDWQHDTLEAAAWLDDLARVFDQSVQAASEEADQILPAVDDVLAAEIYPREPEPEDDELVQHRALGVSLPPRFMQLARAEQDLGSWSARTMADNSLPVRLAVYLKLLGAHDDSYPAEWLDPATGELPTMQQLAALDQLSLPTLRKRRDAAIAALLAAARP
ncbi:MAG: hypothetical protein QFF03_09445 [Pseudomonadota bacterium]|nr:hypothetical protein [Pseudomonadota bacterium]